MGKGDKKTRRGKIHRGSYGKSRPKKTTKHTNVVAPEETPPKSKSTKTQESISTKKTKKEPSSKSKS